MPNESSGKDLQIRCWSLYVRSILHGVICVTKCQPSVKLYILSSPGHFLAKLCASFPEKLPMGSQWNFTCMLMGRVQIAVQKLLTSRITLTFQGHNYVKSHFGPYLGSYLTNCHHILALGSLGLGLLTNQKTSWAVWTWDVRERVTLATIMQTDVFGHNFGTKPLGMTILAPRYMFLRSRNLMVLFVLTYDLDLSRSWPLRNHILGHISVINEQHVAKI